MTVVPGFVDVHIHGAGGHDVMEGDERALDRITSTVARHGTTSFVATTVTAPVDETCGSLQGIARYIRTHENPEDPDADARQPRFLAFISKARLSAKRAAAFIRRTRWPHRRSSCSASSRRRPTGW